MRMLRRDQAARGVSAGPPSCPLFQPIPEKRPPPPPLPETTSLPPPPPPPPEPWPSYPGTAAACRGDPQAVITTEQLPSPQKMMRRRRKRRSRRRCGGTRWSRFENQCREGSVKGTPWGLALGVGSWGGALCVKKWPVYILRMLGQAEEAARVGVGASLTCQV